MEGTMICFTGGISRRTLVVVDCSCGEYVKKKENHVLLNFPILSSGGDITDIVDLNNEAIVWWMSWDL